jgi:hypothetical protein
MNLANQLNLHLMLISRLFQDSSCCMVQFIAALHLTMKPDLALSVKCFYAPCFTVAGLPALLR